MMSLTLALFTQVSGSGPLGPLVIKVLHEVFFIHQEMALVWVSVPHWALALDNFPFGTNGKLIIFRCPNT